MINKAIAFANIVHEKGKRKGTNIPYILHPMEVAIIVSSMKYDENLICAAILHDTIEDVYVSYETIKDMFNKRVADIVKAESEDKSKSWKERKKHTIDHLREEKDEDIKIVALADKLSNIKSMYKDEKVLGDKLWERFNEKDKSEQGWYYKGMVDSLSSLQKYDEYKEFKQLVYKVFGE